MKLSKSDVSLSFNTININMRCIEIKIYEITHAPTKEININMRCIEIFAKLVKQNTKKEININMRCIEILLLGEVGNSPCRLTLT